MHGLTFDPGQRRVLLLVDYKLLQVLNFISSTKARPMKKRVQNVVIVGKIYFSLTFNGRKLRLFIIN